MTTDLLDEFLASLRVERGLAPATVSAYRRDVGQYLAFLDGRGPSPELVTAWLAGLTERGLAATSIARKLAAVRGYHRFLVAEGLAEDDPTALVDGPRRPAALPKALPVEDVLRLLDAPDASTPLGRRDRAILEFGYGTGARVAEIVALDQTDVDLDEATAILTGKGDKQRLVPLGGHAVAAIRAWLPDRLTLRRSGRDPGAVFVNARGGRLTRQGVFGIVRAQANRAGLDPGSVSPHVLRHSAATHMVEGGADLRTVQELLGHATIGTTQVYTRVSPHHLLEVYATSHPRSGSS
ncbi:MAG: site-specific tyrosine recombinase XerD [Acidimicrobiia bacterium]|nr:site-specific tyrosine recombinase XerD [Acidimicrobiia bacterium]